MRGVKGYLGPLDALLISTIAIEQSRQGYRGSMAEIGVFYGRLFFLVAKLLAPNEKALAVDLFDIGASAKSGKSAQLREFMNSARALGLFLDEDDIFVGPSNAVSPRQLLERGGPIRFFSIDGGHELHHLVEDSDLVLKTIAPHGVLCFDDFCNPEWPEVTLGSFDLLRANPQLVPFAVTKRKLYICCQDYADLYRGIVSNASLLARIPKSPIRMLNHAPAYLRDSMLRTRIPYEVLSRTGLGWLSERLYR